MQDSQPVSARPNGHQISVAAEAVAAAQFSRCAFDVSVQYGANQPGYDLIVADKDAHLLKVSVKGSQDGAWALAQNFLADANYQTAIERWFAKQSADVVFCFVQFIGTALNELPRVYLASVQEVAEALRVAKNGRGEVVLYENYTFIRGPYAGSTDKLPSNWSFSGQRIQQLLTNRTLVSTVESKA